MDSIGTAYVCDAVRTPIGRFGGGFAPAIAGGIADAYGIQYTLYFAMGGQLLGVLIALFFKETAPRLAALSKTGEVSELDR